jgi:hypothetical protein
MEGGRYPDVIIELLSPQTATEDRTTKKTVYERVFRTAEYYCYDPAMQQLEGWKLVGSHYQPLEPNPQGWLWCEQFQLWVGTWTGVYLTNQATWLRFYAPAGHLIPAPAEVAAVEQQRAEAERQRAEAEHQRAETERQRAEAAEAELARLRARLAQLEER